MSSGHYLGRLPLSPAYERIDGVLRGGCVLLDGGIATELQRVRSEDRAQRREPWGTWALFRGPMEVLEVHRRYVASGADVISTNTWSVLEAADESSSESASAGSRTPLWLDAARMGLRLARQAIAEAGREGECAAAFCINSSLIDERSSGRLELLSWMWNEEPPDLVILETLETIPDQAALRAMEMICDTGLPLWVGFRRRREGMSTADGQVVPDRESSEFRNALERMRGIGMQAVLVNCVPAAQLEDTVRWLREQTPLPVGCYPNLGHSAGSHWEFDDEVGPIEYARLAEAWVAAGARIIGGCCGVTPAHIEALREVATSAGGRPATIEAGG